jgi:hypothetical protein
MTCGAFNGKGIGMQAIKKHQPKLVPYAAAAQPFS